MKNQFFLIIIILTSFALIAGCTQTPAVQPKVTPTPEIQYVYVTVTSSPPPTPAGPIYRVGDIATLNEYDNNGGVILSYNSITDQYGYAFVIRDNFGRWKFNKTNKSEYGSRHSIETAWPVKLGHIENPELMDVANAKVISTGIQVIVDYPGHWAGAISSGGSSRSIEGTGTKKYNAPNPGYGVSVNAQKQDDSRVRLSVLIVEGEEVLASETTDAAYGIAMTSIAL